MTACNPKPPEVPSATGSRKAAAMAFLRLVVAGRVRDAYGEHVGQGFRHHNPYFRGDAEALITAMEENAAKNPDMALEIQHGLEDGDLVAIHSRVRPKPGDPGWATVHIFRFAGDRVVELWDLVQAVPEDFLNENGVF